MTQFRQKEEAIDALIKKMFPPRIKMFPSRIQQGAQVQLVELFAECFTRCYGLPRGYMTHIRNEVQEWMHGGSVPEYVRIFL